MNMTATNSFNLPRRRIDGSKFLDVANELLVFRKFDDVLQMCHVGGAQRAMEIVFPQQQAMDIGTGPTEIITVDILEDYNLIIRRRFNESLCILAIQAYAETDQWRRVHPFLEQYYTSRSKYPLSIVKMCVLLHVKVNELSLAEDLAEVWLSEPGNQEHDQYSSALELTITRVLVPRSQFDKAKSLVVLNAGLSAERKMTLLKYLQNVEEAGKTRGKETTSNGESSPSVTHYYIQRLRQFIAYVIPATGLRYMRDIACLGFLIYLIVVRTNLDLPSSMSNARVIWSGIVRIWRSLFAPFHLMPRA